MPFSEAQPRREIHHRTIDMHAYARDDGLFDVEAHLVDRKPYTFHRFANPRPVAAGVPLHDLRVRLTLDAALVVRAVEASSDTTPYGVCKEAEATLSVLVGEPVRSGWSSRVKQQLRGSASCTHLMEMLLTMGTTALQGIRSLRSEPVRDVEAAVHKIDSCYAFARHREVVRRIWPHRDEGPDTSRKDTR
ncbi:MAG: DUF2889 domain-containing protein [Rubrivivax sp.]